MQPIRRAAITAAILLLLSFAADSLAATYTTARPGTWSDPGTWTGNPKLYPWQGQAVVATADNGSGKTRLTLARPADPPWQAGDLAWLPDAAGPVPVVVVDPSTLDLPIPFAASLAIPSVSRVDTVIAGHDLTADVTAKGGTNTGQAIAIEAKAELIVKSGVTLTIADTISAPATLTLEGGSTLEIGGTAGASIYTAGTGTIRTAKTAKGNRATIRNIPGTPGWQVFGIARLDLSYANLSGATAGATWRDRPEGSYRLDHVTFDGCGPFNVGSRRWAIGPTDIFSFTDCTFRGTSRGAQQFWLSGYYPRTTGTRVLSGCVFDTSLNVMDGFRDFAPIESCIFLRPIEFTNPNPAAKATFLRCLIRTPTTGHLGSIAPGDLTDCYHLMTDASGNAFFVQAPAAFGVTLTRNTFDAPFLLAQPGNVGDCFFVYPSATVAEHRLTGCLVLPVAVGSEKDSPPYNGKGITAGSLQTGQGLVGGAITLRLDHNTGAMRTRAKNGVVIASGDRAGPYVNESVNSPANASPAGTVKEFRDNLLWDDASPISGNYAYAVNRQYGIPGPDNALDPKGVHHNGLFGLATAAGWPGTNNGTAYAAPTTGTVPGANDVVMAAPPQFNDPSRSFLTWARLNLDLKGRTDAQAPGDVEAGLAAMACVNDDAPTHPSMTIAALNDWVRDGWWAKDGDAVKGKASDGSDIGAVQGPKAVDPDPDPDHGADPIDRPKAAKSVRVTVEFGGVFEATLTLRIGTAANARP